MTGSAEGAAAETSPDGGVSRPGEGAGRRRRRGQSRRDDQFRIRDGGGHSNHEVFSVRMGEEGHRASAPRGATHTSTSEEGSGGGIPFSSSVIFTCPTTDVDERACQRRCDLGLLQDLSSVEQPVSLSCCSSVVRREKRRSRRTPPPVPPSCPSQLWANEVEGKNRRGQIKRQEEKRRSHPSPSPSLYLPGDDSAVRTCKPLLSLRLALSSAGRKRGRRRRTEFLSFFLLLVLTVLPSAVMTVAVKNKDKAAAVMPLDVFPDAYGTPDDDNFMVISGVWPPPGKDGDGGDEMMNDSPVMLNDSPFESKDFQNSKGPRRSPYQPGWRPGSGGEGATQYRPMLPTSEGVVRREYDREGARFVQIYSLLRSANLILEMEGGQWELSTVSRQVDKRALFQLTRTDEASVTLENVHSCRFVCMHKNGSVYTKYAADSDPSCKFTTSWAVRDIASYNSLVSPAHSNSTHWLTLDAGGGPDGRRRPTGVYVPAGKEGSFLFDPVDFVDLKRVLSWPDVSRIYKPAVRNKFYCPDLMAKEKEAEDKKKEKASSKKERKCSEVRDRRARDRCRREKYSKCVRRRRERGEGPLEHPCNSEERRRRDEEGKKTSSSSSSATTDKSSKKKKKTWSKTRNCSSLRLKSDRRVCRREKRARCRARMRGRHPKFSDGRLADMCKAKRWLDRCAKKRAKKASSRSSSSSAASAREECRSELRRRIKRELKRAGAYPPRPKHGSQLDRMIPGDVKYL